MITNDTLASIVDLAGKIAAVVKVKNLTLDDAFDHPDVVALGEELVTLFEADDSVGALLDACDAVGDEFDRLHALPYSNENAARLGMLAATARALSYQAEQEAGDPLQIFKYTMEKLWPYLEAGAKVGIMIAAAAA